MKIKQNLGIIIAVVIVLAGLAYLSRGTIQNVWYGFQSPDLPPATSFQAPVIQAETVVVPSETTAFEPGESKSENYVLDTSTAIKTQPKDPLEFSGELPESVNLDVPFTSQAPFANWDMPYQETCEEASVIMVDAFYKGETGAMNKYTADERLKKMVAFESSLFGYYEDTTAEQTADLVRAYYGYENVIVKPLKSVDDIKESLALGYPVIIPAAGKLLGNPYFSGNGPPYHMLVVRGYTPDFFITNDPGTRRGQGFTYTYDTIMNAAHDWTGSKETVEQGRKFMIIMIPN
ncbi:MAG: C39 family peptidase [Patescibacteria group bacterium]|nr:C39 family peptidase [Patescibacteria group bacterium]MBU2509371.1 C39 family peptidase [Patescibacteria group bacterium]